MGSEMCIRDRYWTRTYDTIGREFPMFPLTVEGLEEAMKKLLVR